MPENNYSTVWANGDNIQAMWNKIKAMFLSAAHDQTSMADSWRTQARNNLGLGRNTLIGDLYAGRAQNDDKGNVITDTYAASMSFRTANGTTYLSIYNNAYSGTTPAPSPLSSIAINASNGLARLDANAKIPLALIPDSIAGQLLYGGTVGATGVVALSQNAKDKWGISSLTITATNYSDYDGVYFIASADFDATRNGYIYYDSSYTGDKTVRMGDWVVSTTLGWVKIDNTDAVRSVAGCKDSLISPTPGITGDVIITAQRVGALDLYLPDETQEVQGKVQFNKDIWSLGGVAARGIADLSINGSGGAGDVTSIKFNPNVSYQESTPYTAINGLVNLPAYPTWNTLSGRPTLATVALSGSYDDLVDKPDIPQGTVTSVGLTVPTGLSVSPSAITSSGIFAISLASGYVIPKIDELNTLAAAIGNLQSSLGTAAYQDVSVFASAEEFGEACNDITTIFGYFTGGSANTAIKLLTPRSIWGKSFDGSADISGALTGVTTINGFTAFDGTNSVLSITGKLTATGNIESSAGNIEALAGGVAAFGIADLSINAGGGTGTISQIQVDGHALTNDNGIVNIALAQGDNNGQIKIGGQNVSVKGLGTLAYLSSYSLTLLEDATEVNKIETLAGGTGTPNGLLKRASNGTWSFDATAYLPLAGGTMSNTNLVTNLNADLLDGKHASELFTLLSNDNEQVSATIGGTNKKLTIDYATKALRMKQETMQATQEFTYRVCPKTIDVDSVKLDRIKGKTLVWNVLVKNGNFVSNSNWSVASGTLSVSGNAATITVNETTSVKAQLYQAVSGVAGHKYYQAFSAKASTSGTLVNRVNSDYISFNVGTSFVRNSRIFVLSSGTSIECNAQNSNLANGATFTIKDFVFVDLTLLYGQSVIDSLTNLQLLEKFESDYLPKYYSYNAGELINNSAKAIESVGFNVFNEHWLNADIDSNGGISYGHGHALSDKIYVLPNTTYCVSSSKSGGYVCAYTLDGAYLGLLGTTSGTAYTFTTTSNCGYIRLQYNSVYATIGNYTFCVNISKTIGSPKNGDYVPHKRVVAELNLHDIHVKSHNIWDEEWESGYYTQEGADYANNHAIRTKNFISAKPGASYCFTHPYGGRIYFYDSAKNLITRSDSVTGNVVLSAPSNCYYLKFFVFTEVANYTYNNDICINESSSFNGQYEPHGVLTFNGLKSAGDAYDEIKNNGRNEVRRIQNVLLKDLTWTNYQTGRYRALLPVPNKKVSSHIVPNAVCDRFTVKSGNMATGQVGEMWFASSASDNYVYIGANAAPTEGELNYELANYETYELVEPIPTALPSGTTERRLPEDTADSVIAPFCADMTYGTNNGDILASATPWEMIHGRPTLDKGHGSDGAWFCVNIGGQKLYIRFNTKGASATNGPGFELEIADSPDPNEQTEDYTKSFSFGTLSSNDIDTICS